MATVALPYSKGLSNTFGLSVQITLETGEIGRQASGAVMATDGETVSRPALPCPALTYFVQTLVETTNHHTCGSSQQDLVTLCILIAGGLWETLSQIPVCHPSLAQASPGYVARAQMVYTTACADGDSSGDGSFAPLQVHYFERFSAAGRTR